VVQACADSPEALGVPMEVLWLSSTAEQLNRLRSKSHEQKRLLVWTNIRVQDKGSTFVWRSVTS